LSFLDLSPIPRRLLHRKKKQEKAKKCAVIADGEGEKDDIKKDDSLNIPSIAIFVRIVFRGQIQSP
jgi:hypothetical protein